MVGDNGTKAGGERRPGGRWGPARRRTQHLSAEDDAWRVCVCWKSDVICWRWAGTADAIKSSVTIRSDRLRQPLAPRLQRRAASPWGSGRQMTKLASTNYPLPCQDMALVYDHPGAQVLQRRAPSYLLSYCAQALISAPTKTAPSACPGQKAIVAAACQPPPRIQQRPCSPNTYPHRSRPTPTRIRLRNQFALRLDLEVVVIGL